MCSLTLCFFFTIFMLLNNFVNLWMKVQMDCVKLLVTNSMEEQYILYRHCVGKKAMIALHRTKLMFFHFKFTIRTNNDFYTSLRAVVSTRNTMLVHFYFKNKSKRNGTCLSLKKSIALRFPTSVLILVQFVPNCFQHYLSFVLILLGCY